MDDNARQFLSAIVDALEKSWLENIAAVTLLERLKVPDYYKFIFDYVQSEEGKSLAKKKFELPRLLIQQAQIESKELEQLLGLLQAPVKPGKPN